MFLFLFYTLSEAILFVAFTFKLLSKLFSIRKLIITALHDWHISVTLLYSGYWVFYVNLCRSQS